jgi:hypothetical protein
VEQISREAELGTLRDLARTVWHAVPAAGTRSGLARLAARLAPRGDLTHAQERAAMAAGLAQAQESRAAWTRPDLVHCIGQHLPDHAIGRDYGSPILRATGPLRCSARTSGNYRRNHTRARLEARWAIRLDR